MSSKDPRRYCTRHPLNCEEESADVCREDLIAPYVRSHPDREVAERIPSLLNVLYFVVLIIAWMQPLVGQQLKPCPWASCFSAQRSETISLKALFSDCGNSMLHGSAFSFLSRRFSAIGLLSQRRLAKVHGYPSWSLVPHSSSRTCMQPILLFCRGSWS
jgi:hypothetical protein